ncbi:MAG TPA: glycosyltransferase family 39 protein [Acidobacteriota bacterium]|nr:glycosyltransferase family 39 protein [Acidobacteriota bacterium]
MENLENRLSLQYFGLAVITLLAAVLRFYNLGEWSFWIDEIFELTRSLAALNQVNGTTTLSHLSIGAALAVFDVNEWSARLAPALIGVISIPILYFPFRKLLGVVPALLASLLLAISPWHLYWSQNVRFYTLLMLLYTLALFVFFFGIEKNRSWYVAAAMLLLGIAARERLTALFFVPVAMSYLALVRFLPFPKPPGLNRRNLVILLLPLLLYGLYDLAGFVRVVFFSPATEAEVVRNSSNVGDIFTLFVGQSNHSPFRLLSSICYRLTLPVCVLALCGGACLIMARSRTGLFLVLGALVPVILLTLISPFMFTVDRYVFVTLPCWALLAVTAVQQLSAQVKKSGKIFVAGVLLMLVMDSLGNSLLYFQYQNGNRTDWKSAFALVRQRKQPDDLVVCSRPEVGRYYLQEKIEYLDNFNHAALNGSGRRVWFVVDRDLTPAEKWIQKSSRLVEVLDVNMTGKTLKLRVYLYSPNDALRS